MPAVSVAHRQQVAVEMHGSLRHACRARREGDQAHMVGTRRGRLEHRRFRRHHPGQSIVTHRHDPQIRDLCPMQLIQQPVITQRQIDPRLVDHESKFAGAQQRHGRNRDAAGLDHRQHRRHHERRVGRSQQHAVARHHSHPPGQHMGDAVHPLRNLRVAPGLARRAHAGTVAQSTRQPAIQQLGDAIQMLGIVEPIQQQVRPLVPGRQVVAGEAVFHGLRHQACRGGCAGATLSSSPKCRVSPRPRLKVARSGLRLGWWR